MIVECQNADMAKLADAPDLGSGSERSEGSSPFIRTKLNALFRREHLPKFDLDLSPIRALDIFQKYTERFSKAKFEILRLFAALNVFAQGDFN